MDLLVSDPATIDLVMQVASTTSEVNKAGVQPVLNTTDATLGSAFDSH